MHLNSCARCGGICHETYCMACERKMYEDYERYEQKLSKSLKSDEDDSTPQYIVVGRAFGGEVAIAAHSNRVYCGCNGGGWHLTDLDTWHKCPHHKGPHPEGY